ncbi:iron ABC transporter permease [Enterobacter wuhouensis]|uniref:Iron ABC transporter permease n=2 Tax=Enterobacter wuhouensis TaxID=2529381 RepID=A0A4R0G0J6_9ENTR|nr:iron ABC transporter permease [Enterobacter wuhouensis]TCB89980.1 iron ABC transporter permease [Enterobacter wuhouensis]WRW33108.1 iron ABC transporter permease [Enterobacter wuhouensis]
MRKLSSTSRQHGLLAAGVLALPLMLIFAASIGDITISFTSTGKAILNGLGLTSFDLPQIEEGIIWQYRMSRALMAACSGGGLALCGLVLQSILRNPLAEPYLLGISAGASLGAVCVMLLGLGGSTLGVSSGAFIGSCAAFALIMVITNGMTASPPRILLAGIAGTQLFNALTAYVVSTSANAEQSRSVMFWLLGSLSGVRWPDALLALAVTLSGLLAVFIFSRALDTFTFGDEVSTTLGIPVTLVRIALLLVCALVTATLVSAIGAVGFVGLVIPHATRMLSGSGHRHSIPLTFLTGAHFMILADIVSRTLIANQVLPIGVVTALVGAPAFVILLYRNREDKK